MRIATWNLERRQGTVAERQVEILRHLALDVVVLTEPTQVVADWPSWTAVSSRDQQDGRTPWVTIVGADIGPIGPPRDLAVGAETWAAGQRVLVYGSVLPWLTAPSHIPDIADGRDSEEFFTTELDSQVADVRGLLEEPDSVVIWAGDFNQTLQGPNHGGSARRRGLLEAALEGLGFEAWNRLAPHAVPGMFAIDLICGPNHLPVEAMQTINHTEDDHRLSDHAGYLVELRID